MGRRDGTTRRTILVVDDEPSMRALLVDIFEEVGYAVRTAQDGFAALAEVKRQPPDLVLSDVMMPHLDGVALHRELRARGHRLPVILYSAAHNPRVPPEVPFIAKPFELERLLDIVADCVAGR